MRIIMIFMQFAQVNTMSNCNSILLQLQPTNKPKL
jgi:hypothetical protein